MREQFKIGDAKKAVNDFKKLCSDERLIIDLMLYYVEIGVEFTNKYGDINESFYNSVQSMYQAVVYSINKHQNAKIFNIVEDRLRAVVNNTSGIGWGFHDQLRDLYYEITWVELDDIDSDKNELKEIKEYISGRLEKRNDLPNFDKETNINKVVGEVINADEKFRLNMDACGISYSNDDQYDFISKKTGYSIELIELILWQRYCYEMENDYWQYTQGKCSKCGSSNLYIKEVPNIDFEDQFVCKICCTVLTRG